MSQKNDMWDVFWEKIKKEKLTVLSEQSHLEGMLMMLRQDWYSPEKLVKLRLGHELELWMALKRPQVHTFFAYYKEPDSRKNDGWGHIELFRCIYAETADGATHLLKTSITKFYN